MDLTSAIMLACIHLITTLPTLNSCLCHVLMSGPSQTSWLQLPSLCEAERFRWPSCHKAPRLQHTAPHPRHPLLARTKPWSCIPH